MCASQNTLNDLAQIAPEQRNIIQKEKTTKNDGKKRIYT